MSEDDEHLIEKITSHETDLVAIYAEVYSVLTAADLATLPDDVAKELPRFDPPEIIEPPKAAAILKAMLVARPKTILLGKLLFRSDA